MLANQGIILFVNLALVDPSISFCVFFPFIYTMCPVHMDCIYLVPSTSSFHIVYFCGMYVPVKMQICVFISNLQYM